MKKEIKDLKKLISIYGAAQVSVWLGYKDTRAIQQWVQRGQIPSSKIERFRDKAKTLETHGQK